MARRSLLTALAGLLLGPSLAASAGLPSSDVIPSWDIQSTSQVTADPADLSRPGQDTSGWHHVGVSRCTLMGCLIASGVYDDQDLFYSANIYNVDSDQFRVPWLYRSEFHAEPAAAGEHYFLETNGITSRADVFVNGHQVADKTVQSGAYGGHTYEITDIVNASNALVLQVYPTDYMHDLAIGFVDWNPSPPDNGTGVWRDVFIRRTGPVALGPLRVVTTFDKPVGQGSAVITLKAPIRNLEDKAVTVSVGGLVGRPGDCKGSQRSKKSLTLQPREATEVDVPFTIDNPAIWWPKQWGDQPLYNAQLSASVDGAVSDRQARKFGVRQVAMQLNAYNDSLFSVNGKPFQVFGAGYAPDIFLRWDSERFEAQARYVLDMGLNTIRLEGKMEHPEMYEIADRLGLMILPGWECCDKWEAWSYNDNLSPPIPLWDANDYATANASIAHEVDMLQTHPSILGFLVGSDFWPNDEAAGIYVGALRARDWPNPIIPYAARKDGYPHILTPPSFKMDGPYDWVPPNYWFDTEPSSDRLGAAFGFGSEQGAGVGTPELHSLQRFLSPRDRDDLWREFNKSLSHMSPGDSSFSTRTLYNGGLWNRLGKPTSLEDYLIKAQIMDYEATRSEYEGFSVFWNAQRPATGVIYWMLNGAWPDLHWNLFDYYLHPAGAYFGTKVGARLEHVAFDPVHNTVHVINHSFDRSGARSVAVDIIGLDGKPISNRTIRVETEANTAKKVADLASALASNPDVVFLRLVLSDAEGNTLSRNVYWVAKTIDTLDWDHSDWYFTPVSKYADFTALDSLETAHVAVSAAPAGSSSSWKVRLENKADVPAFFVRLNLVDAAGSDVNPVIWSDNYVTLWPKETLELEVSGSRGAAVEVSGKNVAAAKVSLA
ncbi:hypothetical protein VTK73DRAFT_7202 [Phialemonium thermophilum]|uniref:Exo-1,4-beta-D-glucosaminidase n=1 Tax=Phialemonium thermophilum TaxID=223376 RepID=A0ABR3WFW7_9PEZI